MRLRLDSQRHLQPASQPAGRAGEHRRHNLHSPPRFAASDIEAMRFRMLPIAAARIRPLGRRRAHRPRLPLLSGIPACPPRPGFEGRHPLRAARGIPLGQRPLPVFQPRHAVTTVKAEGKARARQDRGCSGGPTSGGHATCRSSRTVAAGRCCRRASLANRNSRSHNGPYLASPLYRLTLPRPPFRKTVQTAHTLFTSRSRGSHPIVGMLN